MTQDVRYAVLFLFVLDDVFAVARSNFKKKLQCLTCLFASRNMSHADVILPECPPMLFHQKQPTQQEKQEKTDTPRQYSPQSFVKDVACCT